MICGNCGNQNAYRTNSGNGWESCNECGNPSSAYVPDVYWDGKPEHNLADDPRTGKPPVFASRGDKAAYLALNGLKEAGDRHHGAHKSYSQHQDAQPQRNAALEALRKVKQMGKDVRRQEYLRITQEGQRGRG